MQVILHLLFQQCSACKLVFNTSLWQAVIDCVEKFSWLRNVCSCCSYCWTLWSSAVKITRKGRGGTSQSTYIYHSVCPLVGIGMTPLSQASVPSLPPDQRVGGTLPAAQGVGESQFRRLEKKLSTQHTLWCHPCSPRNRTNPNRDEHAKRWTVKLKERQRKGKAIKEEIITQPLLEKKLNHKENNRRRL